jgi:phospholipase/carboxylesterase
LTYQTLETPDAVTLEPSVKADASVIWLHGLGADGHDFVPVVPELRLPETVRARFVFPHAPVRPVTINNGYKMRAWYDIVGASLANREDEAGISDSENRVRTYIQRELEAGIDSKRIVVAGFSQGGAIALQTALRYPQQLGGVMALSTYLPLRDSLRVEAAAANRTIPILMCHGTHDAIVPIALGESSRTLLNELGYSVAWKTYPMEHSVCLEEINDIAAWLTTRIAMS